MNGQHDSMVTPTASLGCHPERSKALSCFAALSMTGLPSCRALTIAQYKRRIFTTNKHAHNKSIAVLKNTMQNEAYMTPIQYIIGKGSNSSDFLSRICSTTYMRKRRQGESSVGKVGGLVHVLHKHASIRAEIYLGMPAASPDCHPERSEGSIALGSEMLRCAQGDRAITHWPPHCHLYGCLDQFVLFHIRPVWVV